MQLGNTLDEIHAELLPEDKARIIQDYKNKVGPTAMVGDGVNDAAALATADVGISMGISGSSLATSRGHAAILAVAIAGHPLVWLAVLVDVMTCLVATPIPMTKLIVALLTVVIQRSPSNVVPQRAIFLPRLLTSVILRKWLFIVHTHEKKKCCSSGNHSSEPSDQSFSKKAAIQTCKPRCGSVDTHGNKNCCSTGSHSSETTKQCYSRERAVETCELSGRIVYANDKKSCFSASSHSSEIPKSCCSKKIATQTSDPSSSIVQTDDSTKRCSASSHCSETCKQCSSKKVAVEICDPSGGAHSHLELIDDSTWKLGHCVMNDPHHGVCDDECHLEKKKTHHEL
ncbi:cadmium zinc-transporting ATPase [Ancistrocladus abbreviatus]